MPVSRRHSLIDHAKEFRDALVHPSPFIDPKTSHQSKFMIQVGVNSEIAAMVMDDAISYAIAVEHAIGNDPQQSAPWLYGRPEVKSATIGKPEQAAKEHMNSG